MIMERTKTVIHKSLKVNHEKPADTWKGQKHLLPEEIDAIKGEVVAGSQKQYY